MKKKNVTKHALISSIVAMVLCCTMFIGTTFAWFTDSVTSANNSIKSGTLEVDLQMYNEETKGYESIAGKEGAIFSENGNGINWEPNKTEVVYLKVKNNGNLYLKFDFLLSVENEGLIGSLDYAVVDGDYSANQFTSWEQVKEMWKGQQDPASTGTEPPRLAAGTYPVHENQTLAPSSEENEDDVKYFALAVHMDAAAGNEYQDKAVKIDASVFATQAAAESDSFNNEYDEGAGIGYLIYDGKTEFETFLADVPAGYTIYLSAPLEADKIFVEENVTIDAVGNKIIVTDAIEIKEGKALIIKNAEMAPVSVTGNGTLGLTSVTIDATPDADAVAMVSETEAKVNAVEIKDGSTVNLVVKGYTVLTGATNGDGIYVGANATLDLSGTGKLVAKGNGGVESAYTASATDGGSGIGGEGTINIHDMANLTAEGYGEAGFGIGGNTASITIKNTNIAYAKGGYANPTIKFGNYGKNEPEGGAAIGSSQNHAKITLDNVRITKAEGGSKAAGIGATFWVAVEIEINNSTIDYVIGGTSSAGIGGSRVRSGGQKDQTIKIDIKDSIVKAYGGQHGAGIGSGYDVNCSESDVTGSPITTINIKGKSEITAEGGQYAAGIGTGFHVGGLAGEIESTVKLIDVKSGEKTYKTKYTLAQDIGYGVIDPNREGKTADNCTFINQGKEVKPDYSTITTQ